MFKKLITEENVVISPRKASESEEQSGKPISEINTVSFKSDGKAYVVGVYLGDTSEDWSDVFAKEDLSEEFQTVWDSLIEGINSIHLSNRQEKRNFGTDEWIEYVEPEV